MDDVSPEKTKRMRGLRWKERAKKKVEKKKGEVTDMERLM